MFTVTFVCVNPIILLLFGQTDPLVSERFIIRITFPPKYGKYLNCSKFMKHVNLHATQNHTDVFTFYLILFNVFRRFYRKISSPHYSALINVCIFFVLLKKTLFHNRQ